MNRRLLPLLTAACLVLPLAAEAAPRLAVRPGSKLELDGDSTLHPYRTTTQAFRVQGVVQGEGQDLPALLREGALRDVSLTMPIAGFRSGERGLDQNLEKALDAKAHPEIVLKVERYELAAGPSGWLTLHGTLTVAGATRAVDVKAWAVPTANGLHLTGEVPLTMTAFGVKPPVLMAGVIRCTDAIRIRFDLTVGLEQPL